MWHQVKHEKPKTNQVRKTHTKKKKDICQVDSWISSRFCATVHMVGKKTTNTEMDMEN